MNEEWLKYREKLSKKRKEFNESLDKNRKMEIITAWVSEFSSEVNELAIRSEANENLSISMHDLNVGWEIILGVLLATDNKNCLGKLGCWHLEDWLAMHSEAAVELAEQYATKSTKFRRVLSRVYQNDLTNEQYARIKAVALHDGFFEI